MISIGSDEATGIKGEGPHFVSPTPVLNATAPRHIIDSHRCSCAAYY